MADPFTIATGVVSLLASITTLSLRINEFSSDINDSQKDMQSTNRELESPALVLTSLQDSFQISPNSLSSQLTADLGTVIQNCNRSVMELEILLRKSSARRMKALQWAISGKRECGNLRGSLEAHKSTMNMTLTLINMISSNQVQENTDEILTRMRQIQNTLPQGESGFMLRRYLEDSMTYAVSVYEGSTMRGDSPRNSFEPPVSTETPVYTETPISTQMPVSIQIPVSTETPVSTQTSVPKPVSIQTLKGTLSESIVTVPAPFITKNKEELSRSFALAMRDGKDSCLKENAITKLYGKDSRQKENATAKLDVLVYYIKQGVDPNSEIDEIGTALQVVASTNHVNLARSLIDLGADVNRETKEGTALISAAWEGSLEMTKILLDKGAKVDLRGGFSISALVSSARKDSNIAVTKLLLEHGADKSITSPHYLSALIEAARNNATKTIELLVHNGASVNASVDDISRYGRTPLETACFYKSIAAMKLLHNRCGAQVNPSSRGQTNCLRAAASYVPGERYSPQEVEAAVKLVLQWGAKVNTLQENGLSDHSTALAAACRHGHINVVELLLRNGADPNLCNPPHRHWEERVNYTNFTHAMGSSNSDVLAIFKLLVAYGATFARKD